MTSFHIYTMAFCVATSFSASILENIPLRVLLLENVPLLEMIYIPSPNSTVSTIKCITPALLFILLRFAAFSLFATPGAVFQDFVMIRASCFKQ